MSETSYRATSSHTHLHDNTCYHCNQPIPIGEQIQADGHDFCCTGCEQVYQILQHAGLDEFYAFEERKTKSVAANSVKYLPLDDPQVAASFLEFHHEGLARVTFFSPDIHCSSCIWLLENLNHLHKGIARSVVNFVKKEVTISFYTDAISLKEVALLMESVGYAPLLEQRKKKKGEGSDLVTRLAVAGFCFGNSMLLSLPEYLNVNYQIPPEHKTIFAYINFIFALPVFFYSANIYFKSAWTGLKHRFINIDVPISLGILALFLRSAFEIFFRGEMGWVDSLAGLVFFLLIGRWFQYRTYQALSFDRDLLSYFPMAVTKLVSDQEVITRLQDLKEGDRILIRHQELIPADAKLLDGQANIDYSFVTGESLPSLHEIGSQLYAGGRQMGAPITIELTRRVNNSHLTRLWNQEKTAQDQVGLKNISDRISKYFTAIVLLLGITGAVIWWFIDASKSLDVFTAILIIACPCASALAVPFSYGHTLRLLGKHGLYLKNANVIEKLAHATHLIFDKTGTLTKPLPEAVVYVGDVLTADQQLKVYSMVSNSIHPLSKLIARSMQIGARQTIDDFEEVTGKGIRAVFGTAQYRVGSPEWFGLKATSETRARVYVEIDGAIKGYFEFDSVYREQILPMLLRLKKSYPMSLLSGDQDREKAKLAPYFNELHFQQTPDDKRQYVAAAQKSGKKVLMVGDGLNDAGALAASDAGISISDDIYQFSPASEAILNADALRNLPAFLKISRQAVKVVIAALVISFLYNSIGLAIAFMAVLSPLTCAILMPVSSVTVVAFITFSVGQLTRRALAENEQELH